MEWIYDRKPGDSRRVLVTTDRLWSGRAVSCGYYYDLSWYVDGMGPVNARDIIAWAEIPPAAQQETK